MGVVRRALCHQHVAVSSYPDQRAEQKIQTRDRIRQAAQAMFGQRGFDPVTVAELAAAAGVSVQTVFNHFTSKELFFTDRAPWVDDRPRRSAIATAPPRR
jgi:AcrR family transcriptional regulator